MAAISKPLSSLSPPSQLRPFDARRDLEPVADLVELCFADTLDSDGRSYLEQIRSSARQPGYMRWASMAADWASVPFAGFVWQEGDRLVGNASLIPYFVKGRRFYLIANVAVHPDFRRRGIGRSLTLKAIEFTRQRESPSVWLHVREENDPAVQLYLSLGFKERARRTTWYSAPDYTPAQPLKGLRFSAPPSRSWEQERSWLLHGYPPEVAWHMPFHLRALQPGLLGEVFRFIYNIYTQQWALLDGDHLLAAVAWQATTAHTDILWLAAQTGMDEDVIHALLVHARRHTPSQRSLVLDYPAGSFPQAIESAGFEARQTLVWMSLDLPKEK